MQRSTFLKTLALGTLALVAEPVIPGRRVEAAAKAQGRDLKSMTLAEMDALWEAAKQSEHDG